MRPDPDTMIGTVAMILYAQIVEDADNEPDVPEDSELYAFTE